MTLEFEQISRQLAEQGPQLSDRYRARSEALKNGIALFGEIDPARVQRKIDLAQDRLKLRVAGIRDDVAGKYDVIPAARSYAAVAADGSMIDVDRHAPVSSYVMNIGWTRICYGDAPCCDLGSRASLYTDDLDLMFVDHQDGVSVRRVDAQLLGVEQGILELEELSRLIVESPADLPVIGLVDGPLVVWGLADPRIKGLVKHGPNGAQSMFDRYLQAMDNVARAARGRRAAVVGYISRPGVEYVANLVKVARCDYPVADCAKYCLSTHPTSGRGCDDVATIDRHLFERFLDVGQRSSVFRARSEPGADGGADISFVYLRTEAEIARLEIPEWVAANPELLDLAVSLVADQAKKGQGYPAVLIEAHEKAVISGADRQYFDRMVDEVISTHGLASAGSAKSLSKRVRGV